MNPAARLALLALVPAALGIAPVAAQEDDGYIPPPPHGHVRDFAQPADVVAAEVAFARMARDKGQWTAFRAFAATDAQSVTTTPVRVAEQLKGRADPPQAVQWTPAKVWMSCDGGFAVSYGAWHKDTKPTPEGGWFATVWQLQKKGAWRYVLDQGGDGGAPSGGDDADLPLIEGHVADCPARIAPGRDDRPAKRDPAAPPPDWTHGESRDHTLAWSTDIAGNGTRRFTARIKQAGQWVEVLSVSDPTPKAP